MNQNNSPLGLRYKVVKNRRRALSVPIIVLSGYLACTVFIFFFGPVAWKLPSAALLGLFLFINYGGLALGYIVGVGKARRSLSVSESANVGLVRLSPFVLRLMLFSMLVTIFSSVIRLQAIRGDLGSVLTTLMNPGQAYHEAQAIAQLDRDGQRTAALVNYSWGFRISTVLSAFTGMYFPLGLACWPVMSKNLRLLFCAASLCTIIFTMGLGAQSWIGSFLFAALPVGLYKIYVAARPITLGQALRLARARITVIKNRRVKLQIAVALCALVTTVVFFQLDRAEAGGRQAELGDNLVGAYGTHREHGLIPVTGGRLNFGIVMTCLYVSHGYQGLALSMELPFVSTYGTGWSKAIQVIYNQYLGGPDLFERSYLARNQAHSGWPALTWWSTIFPWIASDTTYFGTVFVMFLIGFWIGRVWGYVIISGNPVAFVVLAKLFTLVFMFPANNALAQSLDGLFGIVGVLLIYWCSIQDFRQHDSQQKWAMRKGARSN